MAIAVHKLSYHFHSLLAGIGREAHQPPSLQQAHALSNIKGRSLF